MQAVIQTGGKQYLVAKGDQISIEKLEGDLGAKVTFDEILLLNGDQITVGNPYVQGAKVVAKILLQKKAKKVIIHKYKRRKGYHKTQGHRQLYTRIMIEDITV